ncbi:MAG: 16S rRNA (uracil(1498)-N(3))-methyltransferase, partial [Pseudohongiellaceae bacterium]
MRVPRIYLDADIQSGQLLELSARQSNYLCKALRMQSGRELWLFNGRGGAWLCQIEEADAKQTVVAVGEFDQENHESPLQLELVIALSKGDRFELVLQKATELGITRIQPMMTERTDVKLNSGRLKKKHEHWQGILISACEQSGRNLIPKLLPVMGFEALLAQPSTMTGILLDPQASQNLSGLNGPENGFRLYTGPEGGFSESELALARNAG